MKFEFDTSTITDFAKKAVEKAKDVAGDIAEVAADKLEDAKEATTETLGTIKEKLEKK